MGKKGDLSNFVGWYHSFPLRIGKRGYNLLQELTKIGQLKTGEMLPGLMSLDSVETFRIWRKQNENIDHHALLPLCRLVVVV